MFTSISELVSRATEEKKSIGRLMIEQEMFVSNRSLTDVLNQMDENLKTMENAAEVGKKGVKSYSGLTGYDALRLDNYRKGKNILTDDTFVNALTIAIATNEVNASMGIICATPTAGSAGVVPGVLLAFWEKLKVSRQQVIEALFTAAAFGFVTANNAFIAGAEGGCQAEIGSASGMAAAALVELAGGTPQQASEAFAMALNNLIGLACDPVAGLVEIPCIKRNSGGCAIAISAAEMALASITSEIPPDEVIETMYRVGKNMPVAIRETGIGGLAGSKTGKKIAENLLREATY